MVWKRNDLCTGHVRNPRRFTSLARRFRLGDEGKASGRSNYNTSLTISLRYVTRSYKHHTFSLASVAAFKVLADGEREYRRRADRSQVTD